jgi:hypothetical protein
VTTGGGSSNNHKKQRFRTKLWHIGCSKRMSIYYITEKMQASIIAFGRWRCSF